MSVRKKTQSSVNFWMKSDVFVIKILEERVIQGPIVDKFEELLRSSHSPVCLFPTRKACEEFNNEMLNKLEHTTVEIYCTDDVDETKGMHKWTKRKRKS